MLIAVTDHGDAALTVDTFEQLRLWPALDGTLEPVVVAGAAPDEVALVRTGSDLAAAIRDAAGGLQLVRFDRAGIVLGDETLPIEPGFEQVVACGEGFLVRLRDHRITWLDATGQARGVLSPTPSERILAVAARGDRAIALTADPDGGSRRARWITVGPTLAWGAAVTLARPLSPPYGLAPTAARLVGIDAARERGVVVDLVTGAMVSEIEGAITGAHLSAGFLSNDIALVTDGTTLRWWLPPPMTVKMPMLPGSSQQVAVGDGVLLASNGIGLELVDQARIRYLGYGDVMNGEVIRSGAGFAVVTPPNTRLVDRALVEKQQWPVSDAVVLDAQYVARVIGDKLVLTDGKTEAQHEVATVPRGTLSMWYEPDSRVLSLRAEDKIYRWQIDVSPPAAAPLSTILASANLVAGYLLDPAQANGMSVMVVTIDQASGAVHLEWKPDPVRAPTVKPTAIEVETSGPPLGVDAAGNYYMLRGMPTESVARYGPNSLREGTLLPAPTGIVAGAVAHDGQRIVVITTTEVIALDRAGAIQWHAPFWQARTVAVSRDARTVAVSGFGGVVTLDAATGKRIAAACAWGFELSDQAATTQTFPFKNVCSP